MPANIASERAVLAGLFRYGGQSYVDISPITDSDCFTVPENQVIFKCIEHSLQDGDSTDLASILASAQVLNLDEYIEKKQTQVHLEAVMNTPIKMENVMGHAANIKRLSVARELQSQLRVANASLDEVTGEESLANILSLAEGPVQDLVFKCATGDDNQPRLIGSGLREYLKHKRENPVDIVGIATGIPEYDTAIGGGLRPG